MCILLLGAAASAGVYPYIGNWQASLPAWVVSAAHAAGMQFVRLILTNVCLCLRWCVQTKELEAEEAIEAVASGGFGKKVWHQLSLLLLGH